MLFAKFPYAVCAVVNPPSVKQDQYPLEANVKACNGTISRECNTAGNRTGMCYGLRMMPIACKIENFPITMRKRQVLENVGDHCDPEHEVWLGCPTA